MFTKYNVTLYASFAQVSQFSFKDKQDQNMSRTREMSQQTFAENGTTTPTTPSFIGAHSGVHIYVMPDGRVQHNEMGK